ncbi:MAG: endonuclease/exonuclease/phosphatase family protein [Phycisphaerales bacterium]|nr:MAG: endonuclease/exonuclease/phosphatase family protein [Phycisphaerales bacterium]
MGILLVGATMLLSAMSDAGAGQSVRFAAFNIKELSADKLGQTDAEGRGICPQLRRAAEIIQRTRPDVLLINEIDFDIETRANATLFAERYLRVSQNGQEPIDYAHVFFEPVNTGVPTGMDLSNDGSTDGPDDAYGFGRYPGQYGMALFSRFPIDAVGVRTFGRLLWKDMPGNLMPDGQEGKPAWYSPEEAAVFRLSSKSHWDVPLRIGAKTVHVICAHPTPPIFDGPEDRNGRRTFDEIRLLADYVQGGERASYIVDDLGKRGALGSEALFVVLGDMNAEPVKDEALYGRTAISQLLELARVQDAAPVHMGRRPGEREAAPDWAQTKTCHFGRIDYVLPSVEMKVVGAGVFWPAEGDPLGHLVAGPEASSDHRLVWVDVLLPANP